MTNRAHTVFRTGIVSLLAAVSLLAVGAHPAHAVKIKIPGLGTFNSGKASHSFYFSRSKTRWIADRLTYANTATCGAVAAGICAPLSAIAPPYGFVLSSGCSIATAWRCTELRNDARVAKKKNQCLKITLWLNGMVKEIAPRNNYCIN